MRKTKVICTIGPACEDAKVLSEMCYAGMNVARLNFSHGSHEEHQKKIDLIKATRERLDMPIAIMLDTKGPEYRIGTFENGRIKLDDGDSFIFTTDDVVGNEKRVSVNYDKLMENLNVGDIILVNNGLVIFEVEKIEGSNAYCKVLAGGELSNKKSMNFPDKVMKHDFLSNQDKEDLLFGIKNDGRGLHDRGDKSSAFRGFEIRNFKRRRKRRYLSIRGKAEATKKRPCVYGYLHFFGG